MAVGVDKTGNEAEGSIVGLTEMISICDELPGSVLLMLNMV